jgi:hypothetical protein
MKFWELRQRWIWAVGGLVGGIVLGALWPESRGEAALGAAGSPAKLGSKNLAEGGLAGASEGGMGLGESTGSGASAGLSPEEDRIRRLSPDRLVALFDRVSRLKSESRKYILAYRLASYLAPEQIQQALKAAKEDLEDGDYVTMRALARRWAEIDPKAAVRSGLENRQSHLFYPALESWARMESGAPMQWALGEDAEVRSKTLRALLNNHLLDQSQLEELVARASNSDSQDLRQEVLPTATMRLAETAPGNALFAAGSIDDPQLREQTLRLVLTRVARSAPEVGNAWINAQKDLTPELREQYQAIIARRPPPPPRTAAPAGAAVPQ